jgi:hypothetical protein
LYIFYGFLSRVVDFLQKPFQGLVVWYDEISPAETVARARVFELYSWGYFLDIGCLGIFYGASYAFPWAFEVVYLKQAAIFWGAGCKGAVGL